MCVLSRYFPENIQQKNETLRLSLKIRVRLHLRLTFAKIKHLHQRKLASAVRAVEHIGSETRFKRKGGKEVKGVSKERCSESFVQ